MKNKKWIVAIVLTIVFLFVLYGVYFVFFREEKNSTLTLIEKQWIENNKNKVIDFGVMNHTPIFSSDGSGVFFDYLSDLESDTGLEFNRSPYENSNNNTSDYSFQVVDKVGKNDILFYQDAYALVTKAAVKYYDIHDIKDLTIGVLTSDLEKIGTVLESASNIKYQTFQSNDELIKAITATGTQTTIDAIVIPKVAYMSEIIESDEMNIAYTFGDLEQNYVLRLGNTGKLNTILKKYTKKWMRDHFQDSYNENFTNAYYTAAEIGEKEKATFVGKRYLYGFIEQAPYDQLVSGRLNGMNAQILKSFSNMTGIEITYKSYENLGNLLEDFNANNLDFFYGTNQDTNYKMDVNNTVSIGSEQVTVATPANDHTVITSLASLKNRKVQVVEGTKIESYLKGKGIECESYENITSLLEHPIANGVVVIDSDAYQYYKNDQLSDYKVNYQFYLETPYAYVVRDIKANEVFYNFFNFYLSFIQEQNSLYIGYDNLLALRTKPILTGIVSILVGAILIALAFIYGLNKWKKRDTRKTISIPKGEKIKYIDMLTSLKNRNYLNDNISIWDESEIYPQTIIIIDLNNIAYINDNYGHEEGDKVIKEAANKLITTQIENTDIIRTNGNEFLIYMVGYDEKQVVSYIRKLNKELKDLSHGFGAAIGYSMIHDAIKTIDDAVNEATLDMRSNKEEISN